MNSRWTFGQLARQLLPGRGARRVPALQKQQIWSIGIYGGDSPFLLDRSARVKNPVLTGASVSDVPACFVADPFMIRVRDVWYMFFEVMNVRSGKGEIGLATSSDGFVWQYQNIVLAESFHLSYPYIFEWDGEYYMAPESSQAKSVRLYKAVDFPQHWSAVGDLLTGEAFSDPSIFRFDSKWWLLTDTAAAPYYAGTLRLFAAPELLGPWVEHPKSPILVDAPHNSRPAGRVVVFDDKVYRYAQDCAPVYGSQVRAFEIVELTTTGYEDREVEANPVLAAGTREWNESGMHHVDPHLMNDGKWIACVDGFVWQDTAATAPESRARC